MEDGSRRSILTRKKIHPFFFHCATALVGQDLLVTEDSRSHSDTQHSVWFLWTNDRPEARDLYLTTHNTYKKDIHAPGWIRTHNPSKRATADPRLRRRGNWDWRDTQPNDKFARNMKWQTIDNLRSVRFPLTFRQVIGIIISSVQE